MRTFWLASLLAAPLAAQPLSGTQPLNRPGDLGIQMRDAIGHWLDAETARGAAARSGPGSRDRLAHILGVTSPRTPFPEPSLRTTISRPGPLASGANFDVFAIEWPVLDGVTGEGLLFRPAGKPVAAAILIPDADQTPEEVLQAARLAAAGAVVVVPQLIDRRSELSGNPRIRMTNQPHREFLYRMSYPLGQHIIGLEIQKVLALVDWLAPVAKVGVHGYGEGGLLALYAAALDPRIDIAAVAGYFGPPDGLWRQPIYRNVWGLLPEFANAEAAALAKRIIVGASPHPAVSGPPAESPTRRGAAPGSITSPSPSEVEAEVQRARSYGAKIELVSGSALPAFAAALAVKPQPAQLTLPPDPARHARQFHQLVAYLQKRVDRSPLRRAAYFKDYPKDTERYRAEFERDILGRLPVLEPLPAESRPSRSPESAAFETHEVVLPWRGGLFAYGELLLPSNLRPGERRPVIVAQHGLEGRPRFLFDPPDAQNERVYQRFAAELARRGFIVFVPQNPYLGGNDFRILQRKANPLGLSLFSFVTASHRRITDWLAGLPFVDPARIGYYGLSYGGFTAMRIPAVVPRYAAVVCSGNFNDWTPKIASLHYPFTYLFTGEWEIYEFDSGERYNHFEMAALIAPRPFLVERGHRDGVGIDEWVASEYAKVRHLYVDLGVPANTQIAWFNGVHQIHGSEAYQFLHRHLNWPARADSSGAP